MTLAGGTVPNSASQGPLAAGSYSFEATYNGDVIFYGPASGSCDPIVVGPTGSTTSTTVHDASTNGPWSGTEVTGASAYDTSTVTAINGIQPTGSSTYSFFSNGTSAGTATSTQTVTLAGSFVPNSSSQGPLAAGTYSFDATYNGDSNYNAGTNSCEPVRRLAPTGSTTSTTVYDTEHKWAVVGYRGDRCQRLRHLDRDRDQWDPTHRIFHLLVLLERDVRGHGDLHSDGDPGGRFRAQLLVAGSVGGRDLFLRRHLQRRLELQRRYKLLRAVHRRPDRIDDIDDRLRREHKSAHHQYKMPVTGASAYDTSTVIGVSGFTPTGTLTYSFFANGTCLGTAGSTQTVTLAGGWSRLRGHGSVHSRVVLLSGHLQRGRQLQPLTDQRMRDVQSQDGHARGDHHGFRRGHQCGLDGWRGDGGGRLRHGKRVGRQRIHPDRDRLVPVLHEFHLLGLPGAPDGDPVRRPHPALAVYSKLRVPGPIPSTPPTAGTPTTTPHRPADARRSE